MDQKTPSPIRQRSVLPSVQELLHRTICWLLLGGNLCEISQKIIPAESESEHTVFSLLATLKVKV